MRNYQLAASRNNASSQKRLIVFFVLYLFVFTAFAQIQTGIPAPEIKITHWINKEENPVLIQNKFIVLEFWATWCAPCLASLPHLNSLQKEFDSRKDLVFLSITDEKLEKIKKILPRFHFESTIVSDTTYSTFESFGVDAIPQTVLIDSKGIIRWIGQPKNLTVSLLQDFLAGNEITDTDQQEATVNNVLDSLFTVYVEIFSDKKINNAFGMSTPSLDYSSKAISSSGPKSFFKVQMGVRLDDLFADLLHSSKAQIILPSSLEDRAVSYYFKQNDLADQTEGEKILVESITHELNLEMEASQNLQDIFVLRVEDSLLLNQARQLSNRNGSNVSNDLTVIAINNSSLQTLQTILQKSQNRQIDFVDEAKYSEKYDISLDTSTFGKLQESLASYGLRLEKDKRNVTTYTFK